MTTPTGTAHIDCCSPTGAFTPFAAATTALVTSFSKAALQSRSSRSSSCSPLAPAPRPKQRLLQAWPLAGCFQQDPLAVCRAAHAACPARRLRTCHTTSRFHH